MSQLVESVGVLDRNSCYLYLLLCRDFADTCVIAESNRELAGFVTAYRPPSRPEVLFVWQVGVARAARRQGLAKRMLRKLLSLPACQDVRFLEATVTPSNAASRNLFELLADELGAARVWCNGFCSEQFAIPHEHEDELLIRIGPLERNVDGNV